MNTTRECTCSSSYCSENVICSAPIPWTNVVSDIGLNNDIINNESILTYEFPLKLVC